MSAKRFVLLLVTLLTVHLPLHAEYYKGVLPSNASFEKVKEYWEYYKDRWVDVSGEKASGGQWEFHAFAMVFAAYLEEDQALFSKLWNTVEPGVDWDGHLWTQYKAADVLIDIAMGLDRAAVRWGGKWEGLAERWIKRFEYKLAPFNQRCGCWQDPSGTHQDPLHCGAIAGDRCGHYINYYALSHFFRFDRRTGKTLWMESVMDDCFYTLERAYKVNKLPPWYVRMEDIDNDGKAEGIQVLPADLNNSSNPDKWDGGATRSGWRLPFAYIAFGTPASLKWAQKMYDFYKSKVDDPTRLALYRPSTGLMYGEAGNMLSVCGAGVIAMAVEDQDWVDKVWEYMIDPVNKVQSNNQKDAQRLYCMLKMSGEFDVYGDAEFTPGTVSTQQGSRHHLQTRRPSRRRVLVTSQDAPSASLREHVASGNGVAIYDLLGNLIGRADDVPSLMKYWEQLSPGNFVVKQ